MDEVCYSCGKTAKEKRFFNSKKGKEKRLSNIFTLYSKIEVPSELKDIFLCRNCHDRLLNLHDNATSFQRLCDETEYKRRPYICTPLLSDIRYPSSDNQKPSTSVKHCSKELSSCHVPVGDHKYASTSNTCISKTNKRPKIGKACRQLFPPICEHDHTYYEGSLKESTVFNFPEVIQNYFENSKDDTMCNQIRNDVMSMNNRSNGFVSTLMSKGIKYMERFEWAKIVNEFSNMLPLLFKLVTSAMMPKCHEPKKMLDLFPRLGMVYAIIMQGRHPGLSLIQRMVSMLLMDNICDQKVYDRLQVLGVCLSYQTSLQILEQLGGEFGEKAIKAVKERKSIRLIGDNVNFKTSINEQHYSDDGKKIEMHHSFASAILVNDFKFLPNLSNVTPQRHWEDMKPFDFILNEIETSQMRDAYILIISKVAARFIPSFSFMAEVLPFQMKGDHSKYLSGKTVVLPLETSPLNESKYEDVVQILQYYEETMKELHTAASVEFTDQDVYHIGGDALTRERFSGAKRLRAGEDNPVDRFDHLGPITFEFFHLQMNFLKVFNHYLYDEKSIKDVGTMKCSINRIHRTNFDEDVNKAYDADKEFIVSFTDAHIVELVLTFFGMEDIHSIQTKHQMPSFNTDEERESWIYKTIGLLVDDNILNSAGKSLQLREDNTESEANESVIEEFTVVPVKLANGKTIEIKMKKKDATSSPKKVKEDGVFNYANLVLQLGLIFKELLEVCKLPDRSRIIRIMKQCLVVFRSKGHLSKYALEVLRFLMQQTCLLSEKRASETLYSMFVNTKGKLDTHIPADLQMEYLVKLTKKHIKHMFSNKTSANISQKTKALSSIDSICKKFDVESKVKVRCKKHSHANYHGDELLLIEDLRTVRPFEKIAGRSHACFEKIKRNVELYLEPVEYHEWIQKRIKRDGTDLAM